MLTPTTNTAVRSTAGAVDMSFWLFFILTWQRSDPSGALASAINKPTLFNSYSNLKTTYTGRSMSYQETIYCYNY